MNKVRGHAIEDRRPGMTASFAKTVAAADVPTYAGVPCDINAGCTSAKD